MWNYLRCVAVNVLLDRAIRLRDQELCIICAKMFLPLAFDRGRYKLYQPLLVRLVTIWASASQKQKQEIAKATFSPSSRGKSLASDEHQEMMNNVQLNRETVQTLVQMSLVVRRKLRVCGKAW